MARRILLFLILFPTLLAPSMLVARAQSGVLPESARIRDLQGRPQTYALSCESRSAADWAAYWGVDVSEAAFLSRLPRSDNPETGFVGNPNGAWGQVPPYPYGVHPPPVAALLREYGLSAEARSGLTWRALRAEIAAGRPVIVWLIGKAWPGDPISYTASDGQTTTVARYEHTMIAVGYQPDRVYLVDASSGALRIFPREKFMESWSVLGNLAVVGHGEPRPTASPAPGTYRVESGDYLSELARRFGTTWKELAEWNEIPYPYVIYPGQVLDVPLQPTPTPLPMPSATPTPVVTVQPTPADYEVYVVRTGDYLVDVARRLEVDWRSLAKLNDVRYPYTLTPGQSLLVP